MRITRGTAAIGLAVLAVAFGVTAALLWLSRAQTPDGYGTPDIGGPFELVDHTGSAVTEGSWPGQYLLIYFGYSFCPDVCPTELQNMAAALDGLGDRAARVQPLFITVDPARDTVEAMADYAPAFHPRFVGLTGSEAQVRAAAKAYRVFYMLHEGEDYLVDHSSFVYLMGPDGRMVTYFSPQTDPEQMAARIAEHL